LKNEKLEPKNQRKNDVFGSQILAKIPSDPFRRAIRMHTMTSTSESVLRTLLRHMLIVSDHVVASKCNYPTVKHTEIPDFAKHLIADDSNLIVGSAGSDTESNFPKKKCIQFHEEEKSELFSDHCGGGGKINVHLLFFGCVVYFETRFLHRFLAVYGCLWTNFGIFFVR